MTNNEQLNRYFEAVNAAYDALVEAAESGSKQGSTVWTRLVEETRTAQQDALKLGEKLLEQPAAPQTLTAILETATKAQERAMAFAKVTFEEASSTGEGTRAAFERIVAANRTAAEAGVELTRTLTSGNPFAEAWNKGLEAMNAAVPVGAKRK